LWIEKVGPIGGAESPNFPTCSSVAANLGYHIMRLWEFKISTLLNNFPKMRILPFWLQFSADSNNSNNITEFGVNTVAQVVAND